MIQGNIYQKARRIGINLLIICTTLFTSCSNDEGLYVKYRLLDCNGIERKEFSASEDFLMDLTITNKSDKDFVMADASQFISSAFVVYKKNGELIGTPIRAVTEIMDHITLAPNESINWHISWLGIIKSSGRTIESGSEPQLEPGEYYTQHILEIDGIKKITRINFTIK